MRIEREDLLRLDSSLGRMWLETDGVGGFAASTVLLCATSRYHGLLVTPPPGSVKRHVFLSRYEETLVGDGREFPLSMARYGGVLHPQGHQYASAFELTPFPAWIYRIGDVEVRREILCVRGAPTVLVRWKLSGGGQVRTLHLRPFLPFREAVELTFRNPHLSEEAKSIPGGISVRPYPSLPTISLTSNVPAPFLREAHWYRGVEFSDDLARGYGGHEDQFSPGRFEADLSPGEEFVVAATIGPPVDDPAGLWRSESRRRWSGTPVRTGIAADLGRASDHFLFAAPGGRTGVVAGFPWFGEWGRDTCIALPGLLLPRGRAAECGEALVALTRYLRRGRLPNRFGADPGSSEYAAADPALWFARAVRFWEIAGGDEAVLLDRLRPALVEIATGYRHADGDDLAADEGGLLRARTGASAATWMDAVCDGRAVTPREGCAVEVNALWCFLLDYLARLSNRAGDAEAAREWGALKRRAGKSFLERFWMPEAGRLADCWADGVRDGSVRPNMVIAASLEFSPLTRAQRASIVETARAELLTPRGLRTLSPRSRAYHGRYAGNVRERDAAYHQGTVWPWLLGPYADAYLLAHGRTRASKEHLAEILEGYGPHLAEGALGQVAEVFDGDLPHRPGGAWAQAWSVAELARVAALIGSTQ